MMKEIKISLFLYLDKYPQKEPRSRFVGRVRDFSLKCPRIIPPGPLPCDISSYLPLEVVQI